MEVLTKRQINANIKKAIKNILDFSLIDKNDTIKQIKIVSKKYKSGDEIWLEIKYNDCSWFERFDIGVNDIITYNLNKDLDYILIKYKYFVGNFWQNVGDNETDKNELKYFLHKLSEWINNNLI